MHIGQVYNHEKWKLLVFLEYIRLDIIKIIVTCNWEAKNNQVLKWFLLLWNKGFSLLSPPSNNCHKIRLRNCGYTVKVFEKMYNSYWKYVSSDQKSLKITINTKKTFVRPWVLVFCYLWFGNGQFIISWPKVVHIVSVFNKKGSSWKIVP